MTNEDLLERMFACHHRVLVGLTNAGGFEEFSPLEILALRIFARNATAIGTRDLRRILGCSWGHAARIANALKAKGFVREQRFQQFRSLVLTDAGSAHLVRELPYLTSYADAIVRALSPDERRLLYELLGRVTRSVVGS